MTMQNDNPLADFDIISVYTRQQAIEDGIFVDVTEVAKEAGIKHPVAVTANLFHTHVNPDPMPQGQDLQVRLWDLLNMFAFCCKGMIGKLDGNMAVFPVSFSGTEVTIWAFIEPQSPTDPSPAINLMLPEDY